MVSPMGGNVGDDKGWDDKVISTTMEVGSGDTRYCNTPKYTLVVFDMFRVFCKPNLTVS